ncbi:hypothetical protein BaRGS_00005927 [Batillaria attramentaria]|uniref:isoleucine--tRNA ligase n=1 Tax=Batillaria attramentaria TaxID=370345 RepID=A0ABD0LUR8_9CAEN
MNQQSVRACRQGLLCVTKRLKHSKNASKPSKRYSDTLNLPRTKFPLSVRDGQATKRELEIQRTCGFDDLYNWQWSQPRENVFVLHDGPPYANGKSHVGHAVNKVLKDITTRYKVLRGYRVHYVPGWDCHGMPIEVRALAETREKHKEYTPLQIRDKARKFAMDAIQDQMKSFRRWGVMADWNSAYKTFSPEYQAAQLDVFFKIYKKGFIHRDYMPVYWSPSSRTALAEAELEYNSQHQSTAVYVRFPLKHLPQQLSDLVGSNTRVSAVIWTTTPWTLPFNQAVCFSNSIRYVCLKQKKSSEVFLCEEKFAATLSSVLEKKLVPLGTIEGNNLQGTTYTHPLDERELPFIAANHVLAGKGTGLVHTAPAHGHDDFQVALAHKLPLDCHVDEAGRYMYMDGANLDLHPDLLGKVVGEDADEAVIHLLGDSMLKQETFTHSYPYDWRSKKPVIIRASKQWFVNTQRLKYPAQAALCEVRIVPQQSEHGMVQQLKSRPYWCISRQRVWGLPIPVFYHCATEEPLITWETVNHISEVFTKQGTEAWWTLPISELLPAQVLEKLGKGRPEDYKKGEDIFDIWFDSGVSWASVLKDVGHQADAYIEGMDQFGGWFQTSLLTSVAAQGQAPYKTLLVHGFATDEEGKKMSKSLGNVVDPEVVINGGKDKSREPGYGADVLRWWVAHSHANTNIMIGPNLLAQFSSAVFKVRKSVRYLLSNLYDFDPSTHSVPYESLLPQDKFMLHLLYEFGQQVEVFYDEFSYYRVLQAVERFVNSSLSRFFIHMTRDRCYCGPQDSLERRSCQTVQHHSLKVLSVAAAPVLPHLMEEAYSHMPAKSKDADLLFQGGWFKLDRQWHNQFLYHRLQPVFAIRESITDTLNVENPLEFDIVIFASQLLREYLRELQPEVTSNVSPLCEIMQTSHTSIPDNPPRIIPEDDALIIKGSTDVFVPDFDSGELTKSREKYKVIILPAMKYMCERCRRYTSHSSTSPCERCLDVLGSHWAN